MKPTNDRATKTRARNERSCVYRLRVGITFTALFALAFCALFWQSVQKFSTKSRAFVATAVDSYDAFMRLRGSNERETFSELSNEQEASVVASTTESAPTRVFSDDDRVELSDPASSDLASVAEEAANLALVPRASDPAPSSLERFDLSRLEPDETPERDLANFESPRKSDFSSYASSFSYNSTRPAISFESADETLNDLSESETFVPLTGGGGTVPSDDPAENALDENTIDLSSLVSNAAVEEQTEEPLEILPETDVLNEADANERIDEAPFPEIETLDASRVGSNRVSSNEPQTRPSETVASAPRPNVRRSSVYASDERLEQQTVVAGRASQRRPVVTAPHYFADATNIMKSSFSPRYFARAANLVQDVPAYSPNQFSYAAQVASSLDAPSVLTAVAQDEVDAGKIRAAASEQPRETSSNVAPVRYEERASKKSCALPRRMTEAESALARASRLQVELRATGFVNARVEHMRNGTWRVTGSTRTQEGETPPTETFGATPDEAVEKFLSFFQNQKTNPEN